MALAKAFAPVSGSSNANGLGRQARAEPREARDCAPKTQEHASTTLAPLCAHGRLHARDGRHRPRSSTSWRVRSAATARRRLWGKRSDSLPVGAVSSRLLPNTYHLRMSVNHAAAVALPLYALQFRADSQGSTGPYRSRWPCKGGYPIMFGASVQSFNCWSRLNSRQ
jgi:hypothetical protein